MHYGVKKNMDMLLAVKWKVTIPVVSEFLYGPVVMFFGSAHKALVAIFMWRKSDRHVEVFERLSVICAVSFRRISRESPRGSTLVYVVGSSKISFPF